MLRQRARWLWLLPFGAAWFESCGAMTIEPATPDEPPYVAPPPAPRLVRRDAAFDAADKGEGDHH